MKFHFNKRRWMVRILVVLILGFLLHACANRAFYVPSRTVPIAPKSSKYIVETVEIPNGDDRISAWVLEPTDREALGTVLFSHGNAGNLENHLPFAEFLPLEGYRLILYDYRGYGASTPVRITRESTVSDLNAALDYTIGMYGKPWLMGHSLGSSLSLWVASHRKTDVRGVVAVAPFTSYRAVARSVLGHPGILTPLAWPLGLLVNRGSDPADRVGEVSPTPILFVHGGDDTIIPSRMSEELYSKAGEPKELTILPGVDHNMGWREMGEDYVEKVVTFLTETEDQDL
jgi:hypothetical protein